MTAYRLADVLSGTGGDLRGELALELAFPHLVRDSRLVKPGDLYIGIRGERFDGNDFVHDAAARGAVAAIVSRDWAKANSGPPIPVIIVDDTVKALQRWAAWRRERLDLTVIGITGSVGKTSAKEAIAAALGRSYRVYKSPGNYNNEIGLPLSLLEADESSEAMVLEMGGAYAFGELALLASIAQPRIGVVTNIYPVHLERMGSIEAIAETKSELLQALPSDGFAILNGDDHRVRAMASKTEANVVFFGTGIENDIRAEHVTTNGLNGTSFKLVVHDKQHAVSVPFVGAHGVYVALAGLAVGHVYGISITDMVAGLQDPATQIRIQVVPGPAGSLLIDDTYNASPPSVGSALRLLREIPAKRRIAVLGDMRELGEVAEQEHRTIGQRVIETANVLITYGALAKFIAEETRHHSTIVVQSFEEGQQEAVVSLLRSMLRNGDVVLVKGSRGLEMEALVRNLSVEIVQPQSIDIGQGAVA